MRVLGNPLPGDARVISGESGAVTLGLLYHVLHGADLGAWRERLQLDANSRILCISTEGDTDAARYRRIVWAVSYTHLCTAFRWRSAVFAPHAACEARFFSAHALCPLGPTLTPAPGRPAG